MNLSTPKSSIWLIAFLLSCCVWTTVRADNEHQVQFDIARSVIKIYCTTQKENYSLPWQSGRPSRSTGTGFIIKGRKILTNAHVISDAKFIEVQRNADPTRYMAKVAFAGHDCDLAVLTVEDKNFFKGSEPVQFAETLPTLNDEVTVYGYPLGGARLSITKGVVSRIDYSTYSHSGIDSHLVLQVDAAINPGNSGGPVIYKDEVVGLAFQGIRGADNIGYAIPIPVLKHFITDIEDGKYNGYPELGASHMNTRNQALRTKLGLKNDDRGVVIIYIDPFGSAKGYLEPGDVLLEIDKHAIKNDGMVNLDGNPVVFSELVERKQWGDSAVFSVLRDKKTITVNVPLKNPPDPFMYRNLYDQRPRYLITGGLVFSPLSREYLKTGSSRRGSQDEQLHYYNEYAKINNLYKGKDEFVVLVHRLNHPVNTYANSYLNGILEEVNGVEITALSDIDKALAKPLNGYHVMKFAGMKDPLVLRSRDINQANNDIATRYHISSMKYLGDKK